MNYYRRSPFANLTPVVKNLLIINILFFVAELALGQFFNMIDAFSAFYIYSPGFKVWQIITYMFIHDPDNYFHIIGNMFALFVFGPTLEYSMGSKRFFNYYFICGIGALALQVGVMAFEVHHMTGSFNAANAIGPITPENFLKIQQIYSTRIYGASGAVFGLLLGFGMLFPNVEMIVIPIPVPVKAKYLVTGYILLELFSGFNPMPGDNVAHFAHIGGALVGFIVIKIWGLNSRNNYQG